MFEAEPTDTNILLPSGVNCMSRPTIHHRCHTLNATAGLQITVLIEGIIESRPTYTIEVPGVHG